MFEEPRDMTLLGGLQGPGSPKSPSGPNAQTEALKGRPSADDAVWVSQLVKLTHRWLAPPHLDDDDDEAAAAAAETIAQARVDSQEADALADALAGASHAASAPADDADAAEAGGETAAVEATAAERPELDNEKMLAAVHGDSGSGSDSDDEAGEPTASEQRG